ncbi:MAG: hypothetical protein MUE61_08310 [Vicinamibacterales bacterium]|jgi:hypothetical protein|nr:hypothetical protein [Vicinamibacterales bacterium]MCU0477168.1 hypothetical protein [Chloroflexota bacterium]MCU0562312.1 hypothetical protein [Desulfobacterales bacterium]
MPTIAPAHDAAATGPRDWTEYRAMREAHRRDRRAPLRAILDAERVTRCAQLDAHPARVAKLRRDARDAIRAARQLRRSARDATADTEPGRARDAARASALRAVTEYRTARAWTPAPWPIDPCPVTAPRCPGHARMMDASALRRAARHLHPITAKPARRRRSAAA